MLPPDLPSQTTGPNLARYNARDTRRLRSLSRSPRLNSHLALSAPDRQNHGLVTISILNAADDLNHGRGSNRPGDNARRRLGNEPLRRARLVLNRQSIARAQTRQHCPVDGVEIGSLQDVTRLRWGLLALVTFRASFGSWCRPLCCGAPIPAPSTSSRHRCAPNQFVLGKGAVYSSRREIPRRSDHNLFWLE